MQIVFVIPRPSPTGIQTFPMSRFLRPPVVFLLGLLTAAAASAAPAALPPHYPRPAAEWVEALPVGNGRLGAMVFGGIHQERLQLNEDPLWAGGPYAPANPDALAAL